jgi:hypothetical protein
MYGIKKAPCVLIFRGYNTRPIQITTSGRRLMDDIEEYTTAIFPTITWNNVEEICSSWCVVSCGVPNSSFIDSIYDRPFVTGKITKSSSLAKAYKLSPGEWIAIGKKTYIKVSIQNPDSLISLCSRIYKNDGIDDEGSALPKSQFMKKIDFFIERAFPFEFSKGSVTVIPLMISIPLPFLLVGLVLLVVFLLIVGITNNTKVNSASTHPSVEDLNKILEARSIKNTVEITKEKIEQEEEQEKEEEEKKDENDKNEEEEQKM